MLRRALLPALTAATLLAAPASAFDLSQMTEAEKQAFGDEVRAYLLEHPEVIMEAVEIFQQRQAEAETVADLQLVAENREDLFNDGYSWVTGNPEGDITLVEFMDYRCGYCRKAVPEVASLLESDGNIRLIIKEFPILGQDSLIASQFAIATRMVAGDEAYGQVHDALLAFGGEMNEITLSRLAEELDLDPEPILARMDSDEVKDIIRKNHELAKKLKINGTPTFVLEDEMLRGYLSADQMAQIVAEKRG